MVLGPWNGSELYVNAGLGFHSNDARAAPASVETGGNRTYPSPLARAKGAEVGFRSVRIPHLQTSVALWMLDLGSELVFIGDAGTTEPGRPSRRHGIEWSNYYSPLSWLIFDADVSVSQARFRDASPAGTHIPGAATTVVSAGLSVDSIRNLYGSARWRFFGPRPLIEDSTVRSNATSLVNIEAGYKFSHSMRVAVDIVNLFDTKSSDIDYFYVSRLPGEPAGGIADVHLHPTLPRTVRLNLILGF